MLTIAHRLDTIIENDRVLVMKRGRVREYEHPHVLLQNTNGHFSRMVAAKGKESSLLLQKKAEAVYTAAQTEHN